ncbi:hypothetical protein EUGRSUZ_K02816 [Eucalyptus grandis]|uniref:Uncharacterized protein n=2 Tax=Eucalyptus grandis TaxID=71139 RepID=A0ACC3IXN5_EUCGR|nr:hypothetical protein EUGRSUZ_K02816 [Eucalyptus grandis]
MKEFSNGEKRGRHMLGGLADMVQKASDLVKKMKEKDPQRKKPYPSTFPPKKENHHQSITMHVFLYFW